MRVCQMFTRPSRLKADEKCKSSRDLFQTLAEIRHRNQRRRKYRRVAHLCTRRTRYARNKVEMAVHRTPQGTLPCQPNRCSRRSIRVSSQSHVALFQSRVERKFENFARRSSPRSFILRSFRLNISIALDPLNSISFQCCCASTCIYFKLSQYYYIIELMYIYLLLSHVRGFHR